MHSKVTREKAKLPPCCNSCFQERKTNSLNNFHGQLPQQNIGTSVQFKLRNMLQDCWSCNQTVTGQIILSSNVIHNDPINITATRLRSVDNTDKWNDTKEMRKLPKFLRSSRLPCFSIPASTISMPRTLLPPVRVSSETSQHTRINLPQPVPFYSCMFKWQHITDASICLQLAPLRVHGTSSRQQSLEWSVLGQVNCFSPWQPVGVEVIALSSYRTYTVAPVVTSSPQKTSYLLSTSMVYQDVYEFNSNTYQARLFKSKYSNSNNKCNSNYKSYWNFCIFV